MRKLFGKYRLRARIFTSKEWNDFILWCEDHGFQPNQFLLDFYLEEVL